MYTAEDLAWLLNIVGGRGAAHGLRVLELGDQRLTPTAQEDQRVDSMWAKEFWLGLGARHVCIDLCGRADQALPLNLSSPIAIAGWRRRFDLVVDTGVIGSLTGEDGNPSRLAGVYQCLRNMHNWCKYNGLIVIFGASQVDDRNWYTLGQRFVQSWCSLNEYKLISLYQGTNRTCVAVRKTGDPFTPDADALLETVSRCMVRTR